MMKRLLLFDMDGTLIDPHKAITTAIQHALTAEGIEVADYSQLNYFIGPPIRDSLFEMYGMTDSAKIERIVDKYSEHFLEHGIEANKLYPGIIDMLRQLKDAGFTLTVATSKLMISAVKIAEYLEFDKYFDLIIGCEYDGRRSHKREVIEYVLEKSGEYSSAVMIGDRKYDIIGARETGIDSIGVTWGYGPREELEQENPGLIVDTVPELTQALLRHPKTGPAHHSTA